MAGRRTKLTPELQQTITNLIGTGHYKEDAARYAGIAQSTLYQWIQRGERDAADQESLDGYTRAELVDLARERSIEHPARATRPQLLALLAAHPSPFSEFAEAIKEAEARAVIYAVQEMIRVGRDDWRMWMTYLERTRPERWARRERQAGEEVGETGSEWEAEAALERGREIQLKLIPGGKSA